MAEQRSYKSRRPPSLGRGYGALQSKVTLPSESATALDADQRAAHKSAPSGRWALGWLVTSYVISSNVKEQFTNFGAGGALVFGLLTWLVLAVLLRGTKPEGDADSVVASR